MEELISIIVPIYNSEEYLRTCLNSLINQKYSNIEILLVDNGSTDRSMDICREYQHQDKRIKIYQKTNGYQGAARNLGILKSNGEYIMFVDSDDYVSSDFCACALKITNNRKSDITIFDYSLINKNKKTSIKHIFDTRTGDVSKEVAIKSLIHESFLWNKIFKKDLFNGITFPENRKFEDVSTIYKLMYRAEKITYEPKPLYFYVERLNSTVHDYRIMDDVFISWLGLYSFIAMKYPSIYKSQDVQVTLTEVALFYFSKSTRKNIELTTKAIEILQKNTLVPPSLGYQSKILLFLIRKNVRVATALLNIKNYKKLTNR
ncbi:glycosyltransferase family 2 protein [Limosilactobacillus reuteri subsp. suis]|uniref:glycosyltransferase family 2 protein n=1 Tax=Limosilactobacillus reuteri TaxID=1598 RepID=UPI003996414F